MIELISNLQVLIDQRFDHLEMLTIDSDQFHVLIKDDQKKRAIVRNFRIIKAAEKSRAVQQQKCINLLIKIKKKYTKHEVIACENMIVNCINQYLNTQYLAKKTGQPNDLVDAFMFYYEKINAKNKIKQMKVIKNCSLIQQINFLSDNLGFFISNVQTSINYVYESQKTKFFNLLKLENKSISPQKKQPDEEQEQKFDITGKYATKSKRQIQSYCFQLSKLLNLQHVYIDYFYFSSMDVEKRKKILYNNYNKRNVYIKKVMQCYQKNYQIYKQKQFKQGHKQRQQSAKNKIKPIQDPIQLT